MSYDPQSSKWIEDSGFARFWTNLRTLLSKKQDTLTAGINITISNNVISAVKSNSEAVIPVDPEQVSEAGALYYDTSQSADDPGFGFSFLNTAYPIGSVYLTIVNKNPSTFLGGSWTQIAQGRALLNPGSATDVNGNADSFSAGDNNGEYEHELDSSEIPAHTHTYTRPGATVKPHVVVVSGESSVSVGGVRASTNMTSVGDGVAHNNLQPSFGVYIWKRTA